ncbi:uncharacterized protein TNCT_420901 [Trichonephila clavata]|uniref:Uncharacterized protein n=1 Tax=Trichonephila clavata TaxID=2740835 RepID=A0A8X6FGH4_TRICU|nr:uncharacterized protein TNCT_420901 [Trichonephila clavata]
MKQPNRKWVMVLAVIYNILHLVIFTIQIHCYSTNSKNKSLQVQMGIVLNMGQLITWWLVRFRRKDFLTLVEEVFSLRKDLSCVIYRRLLKISRVVCLCAILLIVWDPLLRIINEIKYNYKYSDCMLTLTPSGIGDWKLIPIASYIFSSTHVSNSLIYTIALFYILFCYSLSACLDAPFRHQNDIHEVYEKVLDIFKKTEEKISFFVLLLFAYIFYSFFKYLFVIIYLGKTYKVPIPLFIIFNFVANIILIIVIILSAHQAQQKTEDLRISLLADDTTLKRRLVKILEDQRYLKLTGWGIFTIQKSLLLSSAAWFFTYVSILVQS